MANETENQNVVYQPNETDRLEKSRENQGDTPFSEVR